MCRKTGVYQIRNLLNGKVYIGSASQSFGRRWGVHCSHLRKGTHPGRFLQSAWKKCGENLFVFEILEECPPKQCVEREQFWLDKYLLNKPVDGIGEIDHNKCYNLSPTAGSTLGVKHSGETRKKLSEVHKGLQAGEKNPMYGRHHSGETRRGMSEHRRGRRSGENHPMYGRHHSEESRRKNSEAHKGLQAGENNPMYGRHHTEEVCRKLSEAQRGKYLSEETRKKLSEALSGERHPNSVLTWEQVREIRKLHKEGGVSQVDLALRYGVQKPAIWKIIHRLLWKE